MARLFHTAYHGNVVPGLSDIGLETNMRTVITLLIASCGLGQGQHVATATAGGDPAPKWRTSRYAANARTPRSAGEGNLGCSELRRLHFATRQPKNGWNAGLRSFRRSTTDDGVQAWCAITTA